MLLAYSMPAVTAAALSGSAGSAWLVDGAAACYDGNPARKARLQWASAGAPAITDYVQVELTVASTSMRVCAILGLSNVPVGTVVRVYGKRPADGSVSWDFGGQNEATVVQFADGTFGAWFVLPDGAAAVTKVGFRFYNNAAGVTWATAATTIDIGELVAMPAVEMLLDRNWAFLAPGTSSRSSRTRASQIARAVGVDYRRLALPLDPAPITEVRGGGLANGMDWHRLRGAFAGLAAVVAIPRGLYNGVVDLGEVNATALYGVVAGQGDIAHAGGDQYTWSLTVEEVPAV